MLRYLAIPLFAFTLLAPQSAGAQSTDSAAPLRLWASGSVGASTTGLSAIAAGTVHVVGRHLFTGRVIGSHELRFELFDRTAPQESTWEAGLLYGQAAGISSTVTVSAAAGFGVVGGVRRGEFLRTERKVLSEGTKVTPPLVERTEIHRRETLLTVGLPVETGLAFRPLPFLGIGAIAFGNLNAAGSFAGVAVQVQAGWWK